MKWKIWERVMNAPEREPMVRYCQCGGRKTRQTTLDEFFDMTPESQQRLFPVPVRA
jgi:hypothetical protein